MRALKYTFYQCGGQRDDFVRDGKVAAAYGRVYPARIAIEVFIYRLGESDMAKELAEVEQKKARSRGKQSFYGDKRIEGEKEEEKQTFYDDCKGKDEKGRKDDTATEAALQKGSASSAAPQQP